MGFLVAAALCVLAITSGANAEAQTQTVNINNQAVDVSSAFSRLAADVAATIPMNVESATQNNAVEGVVAEAAKPESSLAAVDSTIIDTQPAPTGIIFCPSCALPRSDLVPTLTISGDDYSIVYPPNSISVKNIGDATSKAATAKLWCKAWTNTFPPQVIPGNIVYDENGQGWGICFGDITLNIPPIAPGASYYPALPFNPFPISCRKPAGKCEVHFKVDVSGTNSEKSELNNEVIRYKTNVASNPPNWP